MQGSGNRVVGIFYTKGGLSTTVRHAEFSDLEAIFNIIRDRRREFEKMGKPYMEITEEEKASWVPEIEDSKRLVLVAEINGQVVGHTNIGKRANTDGDTVFVFSITVLSKYRQNGLGRALLVSGIWEAEDFLHASAIGLCVAEPNFAKALYESCGFKQVGEPFDGVWIGKPVRRLNMLKHLELQSF